jgi:hypothetical protein
MTATAIGSTTKLKVRQLLEQCVALPGIRDVYGYLWFPRISNGFRGVFDTFEQAQQAIAQHLPVGYDHTKLLINTVPRTLSQLDPSDRPLLPYLETALIVNSKRVFDLGGSVGRGYYTYQCHM